MRYESPKSYTDLPGLLTLEGEDPEAVKEVFKRHYLTVTNIGIDSYKVTVDKSSMGILTRIVLFAASQATYLHICGEAAVAEYKKVPKNL